MRETPDLECISSKNTLNTYRFALEEFFSWYEAAKGEAFAPDRVTSTDLREYQEYLQTVKKTNRGTPFRPSSVNLYMRAVRVFLKWAETKGYGKAPTFPKRVELQNVPPKTLTRAEQDLLLREAERRGKARDVALVQLLMSCGLRVSEVVSVKVSDLNKRQSVLTVRGKGGMYREVPVPPEARRALRKWLEERKKKYPGSEYLFSGRREGHVTVRYVEKLVKDLGQIARLEIHPQVLRQTAAANMMEAGADLVTVAKILGHFTLNAVAIYRKPNIEKMAEALERGEV